MQIQTNDLSHMEFINQYEVDSVENAQGDTFLCMLVPTDSDNQNVAVDVFAAKGIWAQMVPAVLAIDGLTGARAAIRIKIATTALAPFDEKDEIVGSFEICPVRGSSDVYYRALDVINFYHAIVCARISERLQGGYSPEIEESNRRDCKEFVAMRDAINKLSQQYGPELNLMQLTGIDALTEGQVPAARVRAFIATLTIVSFEHRALAAAF